MKSDQVAASNFLKMNADHEATKITDYFHYLL